MIDPHPRSFLYAACWLHENDQWDYSFFLPCGLGTDPENVTNVHPDGVTLIGPPARSERFRRIAEHFASKVLAIEDRAFRSITGITGELDAAQRDYVKRKAEIAQRELAHMALYKPSAISVRLTEEGHWRPLRETVTEVTVGCHAFLGRKTPNRNQTADALNTGLPRSSAVSGVTGDFVRNALETYAKANLWRVHHPGEHPCSLPNALDTLAYCCRLYGHLWHAYSERSQLDPFSALATAYESGELDETIMQFQQEPFEGGPAVGLELLSLMSRRLRAKQSAAA